jgi:arylsulfatase A-like enzyme
VTAGLDRIDSYSDGIFGSRPGSNRLREPDDAIPQSFTTRVLTDRAIDWARNLPDEQPSFLWLHYFDPHYPYLPPARYIGPAEAAHPEQVLSLNRLYWANAQYPQPENLDVLRRLYLNEVQFVDEQIGRFLDVLKEEGIEENSIIVFVSDHGEGFGEHGRILHGFELYQELLHVPFLIRLPGGARQTRVSAFVPTGAVVPTLVELLKLDTQPQQGWPPSLAPLMENNAAPYGHPVVSGANHKGEPQWSIILGGLKYVFHETTADEVVYDLNTDPGEQQPLKNPPESFLSEARAALKQHFEFAERTLATF